MVVDDDAAVRTFVTLALERYGYAVMSAASGPEALELAEAYAGGIDVLLADICMADMTGPELADQFLLKRPRMRVLLMSGESSACTGACLRKPFHAYELRQAIDRLLARPLRSRKEFI